MDRVEDQGGAKRPKNCVKQENLKVAHLIQYQISDKLGYFSVVLFYAIMPLGTIPYSPYYDDCGVK